MGSEDYGGNPLADEEIPPLVQLQLDFSQPGMMHVHINFINVPDGWPTVVEALHAAYKTAVRKAVEPVDAPAEEHPRIVIPSAMPRNLNGS